MVSVSSCVRPRLHIISHVYVNTNINMSNIKREKGRWTGDKLRSNKGIEVSWQLLPCLFSWVPTRQHIAAETQSTAKGVNQSPLVSQASLFMFLCSFFPERFARGLELGHKMRESYLKYFGRKVFSQQVSSC